MDDPKGIFPIVDSNFPLLNYESEKILPIDKKKLSANICISLDMWESQASRVINTSNFVGPPYANSNLGFWDAIQPSLS